MPANLARALHRTSARSGSAVSVTGLPFSWATRRCYAQSIGPMAGQVGKGGSGGDPAPGVLRSGCRCGGEIEHNTLLWLRKSEQGQVSRRAGTSIVVLGRSFMPSTPNGANSHWRGRGPTVCLNSIRASVRVGERNCRPACLRRLQAVERNGAKAADARASVVVSFEVGRGRAVE